ncbi:Uncharacterized protein APZ42_030773 [Daphnia magna]|uniref:Uncharacterized protein n=1 Tax=Daphnia magna TaxID=35525 RepID=A0A162DCK6_9CRUS|nr:Uncharacterized protein APZ42_030773 [Daphnia magna]
MLCCPTLSPPTSFQCTPHMQKKNYCRVYFLFSLSLFLPALPVPRSPSKVKDIFFCLLKNKIGLPFLVLHI